MSSASPPRHSPIDDAVGAHTQRPAHQIADRQHPGDAISAGDRRRSFQPDDVPLRQLKFGGVLNRDDAFVVWDIAAQNVEQRRFTGTRTARNHDIQARLDAGFQELGGVRADRAEGDQVVDIQPFFREFTDGDRRPQQR